LADEEAVDELYDRQNSEPFTGGNAPRWFRLPSCNLSAVQHITNFLCQHIRAEWLGQE